ncbi:hypothetical protein FACS1894124_2620 [Spirochaetia bacterium]|nr:hypothetical protein FACS1894124_2620 [Spirochaetia bacterium]
MKNRFYLSGRSAARIGAVLLAAVSVLFAACRQPTSGGGSDAPIVTKTALRDALKAANTLADSVFPSINGSDVPQSHQWAAQTDINAYLDAIAAAEAVNAKKTSELTQAEVDAAIEALKKATDLFKTKLQDGTKPQVTQSGLEDQIEAAELRLNATEISDDGTELLPYVYWVTNEVFEAYYEAIEAAREAAYNSATDDEINQASVDLDVATLTFNTARKPGTRDEGEVYISGTLSGGVDSGTVTLYADPEKTTSIGNQDLPKDSTEWRIGISKDYIDQTVYAQIESKGQLSELVEVSVTADGADGVVLILAPVNVEYSLKFDGDLTNTKLGPLTMVGTASYEDDARDGRKAIKLTKDNYVNLGKDFDYDESFSVAFRVKVTSTSSDQAVFGNKRWNSGGGSVKGFVICMTGNSLKVNIGNGSSNLGDVSLGNVTTGWAHIAVVFDKETGTNGQVRYYYNGSEVSTKNYNISGGMTSGLNSYIGQTAGNADDSSRYNTSLTCQIQDFLLVNQKLGAEEIADFVDPVAPELVFEKGKTLGTIDYSWTVGAPGGLTYELYYKAGTSIAADGSDGTLATTQTGAFTGTLSGLTDGAAYSAVLKVSKGGKTAYSTVKQAAAKEPAGAYFNTVPGLTLATGATPGEISYTWTAADPDVGVTYALIYVKGEKTTVAAITGASPTTVTLTTPGSGTVTTTDYDEKYSAVVSAAKGAETVYSAVKQATTRAKTIAYSLKFDGDLTNTPGADYLTGPLTMVGTETYEANARDGRKAIDLNYQRYINLGKNFDYNQSFTFAFWVKVTGTVTGGTDPVIFGNKDYASGAYLRKGFVVDLRNTGIVINSNINTSSAGRLNNANEINLFSQADSLNKWVHIAVVYDKEINKVTAYCNGVQKWSYNHDLTNGIGNTLNHNSFIGQAIGSATSGSTTVYNTSSRNVPFLMQDFLLVNQKLTAEEIAALAQ